jgi:prepilin-type N-terminal cleavage/methylation domain-containing protein
MRAKNAFSLTGFTLVELLVAISIIAMLTGILLPALGAARRNAYKTGCKQNLHGCAIAFRMYLDDNKNIMPTIGNMPSLHLNDDLPINIVLAKYISGPEALKCPADSQAKYFRKESSSYEYDDIIFDAGHGLVSVFNHQNRKIEGKGITHINFSGESVLRPWAEIRILRDYSGFHGKQNNNGSFSVGAYMYLYADNLIADRERNK